MRLFRGAALPIVLILAGGCGDDGLFTVQPQAEVRPAAHDFGAGCIGEDNLAELTLTNVGEGILIPTGGRVEPPGAPFSIASFPASLPPGAEGPLVINYRPTVPKQVDEAMLYFLSNDPERPEIAIAVRGVGGVREIEVTPTFVDFAVVDEGTAPRRGIQISNIGGEPLVVRDVVWTSTSVDLRLIAGFSGTLAAKTSTVVEVVYAPTDLGADRGIVTITSDDEDEPEVVVPVSGSANLAPRAIAWGCDTVAGQVGCDDVETGRRFTLGLGQRVGLDARESYDPEGGAVQRYVWRVVSQPAGARGIVFHSSADRARQNATGDFEVPQGGLYDLRLVVTDIRGLESLDRPESHVLIGPRDLEVLLTWDIDTDVDLHFVRPGGGVGDYGLGGVGTSTGSDCSTFNRNPNWGDPMSARDNPRLDIDVVRGRGPEITSLNHPEEGGVYRIFAHYCDSQSVRVPVTVQAELRVRGQTAAMFPSPGAEQRLGAGDLWEVATVRWVPGEPPTAEVVEVMGPPVSRPDLCMLR